MISREKWARLLGVDPRIIEPGARLGPPVGTCIATISEVVLHPFPGEIWITSTVREAIESSGLTGVSFAKVNIFPDCEGYDFSEIVVLGRAWRQDSTEDNLRLCDLCGRRGFPAPKKLMVDMARWDGSDFMFLDGNPNIVIVSERTAKVFWANNFSNVIMEPVD